MVMIKCNGRNKTLPEKYIIREANSEAEQKYYMDERIKFGLGEKIILIILSMSMLITIIMGIIFYQRSTAIIKKNYQEIVTESLKSRADLFDSMMKEAYLTCVYSATNADLKELMKEEQDYEALKDFLAEIEESSDDIHSAYCYVKAADKLLCVSTGSMEVTNANGSVEKWMENILENTKSSRFSPVYNQDNTSSVHRNYFTFGKTVYEEEDGEELGALFINVDERQVYFNCLQNEEDTLGELCIVQNDQVVSSSHPKQLRQSVESIDENADTDRFLILQPMTETEYYIRSSSSMETITGELRSVRNWIILVALILNLIFSIPALFIIYNVMKPMKKLEEKMNRVKEGDLSVRAEIYRNDEIGSLSENFNEMLEQVERLIDEIATQKLLKKEAELEALSYQITPHFMYNTLSSIRYAAMLENYNEIADLLQAFIELLRLSASDRGAFITVQQEMKMVKNYIKLQQFRYRDSFEAELEIEDGTELFYVPRLLVQPLVENAILHGLDHREENNLIRVSVRMTGGKLEIMVKDNGAGMTKEEIENLVSGKYHTKFSGIGINNIIERLRLYYGSQGQLEYRALEGGGTTAVLTLPASDNPDAYII